MKELKLFSNILTSRFRNPIVFSYFIAWLQTNTDTLIVITNANITIYERLKVISNELHYLTEPLIYGTIGIYILIMVAYTVSPMIEMLKVWMVNSTSKKAATTNFELRLLEQGGMSYIQLKKKFDELETELRNTKIGTKGIRDTVAMLSKDTGEYEVRLNDLFTEEKTAIDKAGHELKKAIIYSPNHELLSKEDRIKLEESIDLYIQKNRDQIEQLGSKLIKDILHENSRISVYNDMLQEK